MNPEILGPYELLWRIDRVWFSSVYLARSVDEPEERWFVIERIFRDTGPDFRSEFERRANLEQRLEHPRFLPLRDWGIEEDPSGAYVVRDAVEGCRLNQLLGERPVHGNPDVCTYVLDELLDGLGYALGEHKDAASLIQEALHPRSIWIGQDGDVSFFRIANPCLPLDPEWSMAPDDLGDYLSPEAAANQAITPASCVFSMGVILYELLTGTHPFKGSGLKGTLVNILRGEPQGTESIPSGAESLLQKALARKPEERFQTPAELQAAMREALPRAEEDEGENRAKDTLSWVARRRSV